MTPDGAGRGDVEQRALRAHAAELLASKQFSAARACYEQLLGEAATAADLEGLGIACRALDDISGSVAAYERAYRLRVEAGETAAAGMVACTLADIELSDLGGSAVAAGWLARARHHLGTEPEHPGHALVDALSSYRFLAYEKDPDAARSCALRSVARARRGGDAAAEIMSTAYLGLIEVSRGELAAGFDLLDEAAAAALAGELPALADLDVYCLLITACERVRDLDRATQWTERVLALATGPESLAFATFARTHYAALLIWRGRWADAERELGRVLRDAAGRPMSAAVAMVLRCALRRRQGRLDEAATELAACEKEPFRHAVRHLVLAARAALELDRGHAQEAADIAERYLRAVSASDVIERIDALQTLVPARLALGEVDAADAAAAQLESVAQAVPTDAIRATAAFARAAVLRAQDRLEPALDQLDTAIALFEGVGMGYESVASRVALAELLLELGRVGRARVVAETAAAGATELGARGLLATAHALLRRIRPDTASAAGGLTSREIEIVRLIASGLTNAEIAERLVLSPRTVERHMSNIYLKLGVSGAAARTVAAAHARRLGLLVGDR